MFMHLRLVGEFLFTPPLSSKFVAWGPDLPPPFAHVNSPSSLFNPRILMHYMELNN